MSEKVPKNKKFYNLIQNIEFIFFGLKNIIFYNKCKTS